MAKDQLTERASVGAFTALTRTSDVTLPPFPATANERAEVARSERINFLDVAKGIGILLVVAGHCLRGLYDAGMIADNSVGWLAFYLIYCFHMPLFFFLAGCLVEARIKRSPGRFLQSNLTRIAYPYFLWGLIQTAILLLASGVITHTVSGPPLNVFVSILWQPPGQLWFLYVLFFLHLIAPITLPAGGKLLFVAPFVVLYAICTLWQPAADALWSFVSGTNILFYVLGVCIGGALTARRDRIMRPYATALILAVVAIPTAWHAWTIHAEWYSYATLPAACAGTVAIVVLSQSALLNRSQWLIYLGRRSMPIYVLHVLFVAGTRIVLLKVLHVSGLGIVLPAIFLAGVIGPLIVESAARRLRLHSALGLG